MFVTIPNSISNQALRISRSVNTRKRLGLYELGPAQKWRPRYFIEGLLLSILLGNNAQTCTLQWRNKLKLMAFFLPLLRSEWVAGPAA
jgi:hypothetical protein